MGGGVEGAEGQVTDDVRERVLHAAMIRLKDRGWYNRDFAAQCVDAVLSVIPLAPTAALAVSGVGAGGEGKTIDQINAAYDDVVSSLARAGEVNTALREGLSWALDLLDMYDTRLAAIDGADRVYAPIHLAGKAKARAALAAASADVCSWCRKAVRDCDCTSRDREGT